MRAFVSKMLFESEFSFASMGRAFVFAFFCLFVFFFILPICSIKSETVVCRQKFLVIFIASNQCACIFATEEMVSKYYVALFVCSRRCYGHLSYLLPQKIDKNKEDLTAQVPL